MLLLDFLGNLNLLYHLLQHFGKIDLFALPVNQSIHLIVIDLYYQLYILLQLIVIFVMSFRLLVLLQLSKFLDLNFQLDYPLLQNQYFVMFDLLDFL
ncbi:MAG: hypothetical protein EBR88_01710 [Betaproteobacteria bacterium]|nr:hypothetical protein [Betaproteobacteria bacterium]NBX73180.1 hypothetical protein [Alphaproteobacteria bacterium]